MRKLKTFICFVMAMLLVTTAAFAHTQAVLRDYFYDNLNWKVPDYNRNGGRANATVSELWTNLSVRTAWVNAGLITVDNLTTPTSMDVTAYGDAAIPAMNILINSINDRSAAIRANVGWAEAIAKYLFLDANMRNTWDAADIIDVSWYDAPANTKPQTISLTAYGQTAIVAIHSLTAVFKAAPLNITESGVADALAQGLFTSYDMRKAWVDAGLIQVTGGTINQPTSLGVTTYGNVAIPKMRALTTAITNALAPLYGGAGNVPGGIADAKAQALYTNSTTRNLWASAGVGIISVTPYAADPTKPDTITLTAYGQVAVAGMQQLTDAINAELASVYPDGVPAGIAEARAEALFTATGATSDTNARLYWMGKGLITVTAYDATRPQTITLTDYGRVVVTGIQSFVESLHSRLIYTGAANVGRAESIAEGLFLNAGTLASWEAAGFVTATRDGSNRVTGISVTTFGYEAIPSMIELSDWLIANTALTETDRGVADAFATLIFSDQATRDAWNAPANDIVDIIFSSQDLPIWGISPAYNPSDFDDYMVLWTPLGSQQNGWYMNGTSVISPYAAFLALDVAPQEAMENINNILTQFAAAYDTNYGFHDSINASDGTVSEGYATLDQGMILVSITNILQAGTADARNGVIQDLFASSSRVSGALDNLLVDYSAITAPDAAAGFSTDRTLSAADRAKLLEIATKTWAYFAHNVNATTGLPENKATNLTDVGYASISDIGMYLMSIVSANKLGLITAAEAKTRILQVVTTLTNPLVVNDKWNGFFRNYYHTDDLQSLTRGDRFISTVDNGWLATGLLVAAQAFAADPTFAATVASMNAIVDAMDFTQLYNGTYLATGYDAVSGLTSSSYGLLYTEIRPALLIAIGTGDLTDAAWTNMMTALPNTMGQSQTPVNGTYAYTVNYGGGDVTYHYMPSWNGSMFEGLMPNLVLNNRVLSPAGMAEQDIMYTYLQQYYATGPVTGGYDPDLSPITFTAQGGLVIDGMIALTDAIKALHLDPPTDSIHVPLATASGIATVMFLDYDSRLQWSNAGILTVTGGTMTAPTGITLTAYGQRAIVGIVLLTEELTDTYGMAESDASGLAATLFTADATTAAWHTAGIVDVTTGSDTAPERITVTNGALLNGILDLTDALGALGLADATAAGMAAVLFTDIDARQAWVDAGVITISGGDINNPTQISIADGSAILGIVDLTASLMANSIPEEDANGIASVLFLDQNARAAWAAAGLITVDDMVNPATITVANGAAIRGMVALKAEIIAIPAIAASQRNQELANGIESVLFTDRDARQSWYDNLLVYVDDLDNPTQINVRTADAIVGIIELTKVLIDTYGVDSTTASGLASVLFTDQDARDAWVDAGYVSVTGTIPPTSITITNGVAVTGIVNLTNELLALHLDPPANTTHMSASTAGGIASVLFIDSVARQSWYDNLLVYVDDLANPTQINVRTANLIVGIVNLTSDIAALGVTDATASGMASVLYLDADARAEWVAAGFIDDTDFPTSITIINTAGVLGIVDLASDLIAIGLATDNANGIASSLFLSRDARAAWQSAGLVTVDDIDSPAAITIANAAAIQGIVELTAALQAAPYNLGDDASGMASVLFTDAASRQAWIDAGIITADDPDAPTDIQIANGAILLGIIDLTSDLIAAPYNVDAETASGMASALFTDSTARQAWVDAQYITVTGNPPTDIAITVPDGRTAILGMVALANHIHALYFGLPNDADHQIPMSTASGIASSLYLSSDARDKWVAAGFADMANFPTSVTITPSGDTAIIGMYNLTADIADLGINSGVAGGIASVLYLDPDARDSWEKAGFIDTTGFPTSLTVTPAGVVGINGIIDLAGELEAAGLSSGDANGLASVLFLDGGAREDWVDAALVVIIGGDMDTPTDIDVFNAPLINGIMDLKTEISACGINDSTASGMASVLYLDSANRDLWDGAGLIDVTAYPPTITLTATGRSVVAGMAALTAELEAAGVSNASPDMVASSIASMLFIESDERSAWVASGLITNNYPTSITLTAAGRTAMQSMMNLKDAIAALHLDPPTNSIHVPADTANGMASSFYVGTDAAQARSDWAAAGYIVNNYPASVTLTAVGELAVVGIVNLSRAIVAVDPDNISDAMASGIASSLYIGSNADQARTDWSAAGLIDISQYAASRTITLTNPAGTAAIGGIVALSIAIDALPGISSSTAGGMASSFYIGSDAAQIRSDWALAGFIVNNYPTSITLTATGENAIIGMTALTSEIGALYLDAGHTTLVPAGTASGMASVLYFDSAARGDWANAGLIDVSQFDVSQTITLTAQGENAIPGIVNLTAALKAIGIPETSSDHTAAGIASSLFTNVAARQEWADAGIITVDDMENPGTITIINAAAINLMSSFAADLVAVGLDATTANGIASAIMTSRDARDAWGTDIDLNMVGQGILIFDSIDNPTTITINDPVGDPDYPDHFGPNAILGMMQLADDIEAAGASKSFANGIASALFVNWAMRLEWDELLGAGYVTFDDLGYPTVITLTTLGQTVLPNMADLQTTLINAGFAESVAGMQATALFVDDATRDDWVNLGYVTTTLNGEGKVIDVNTTAFLTAMGTYIGNLETDLMNIGFTSAQASVTASTLFVESTVLGEWLDYGYVTRTLDAGGRVIDINPTAQLTEMGDLFQAIADQGLQDAFETEYGIAPSDQTMDNDDYLRQLRLIVIDPDYDQAEFLISLGGTAVQREELYIDFGANGFWKYDGTDWTSLTTWSPDSFMLSDLNGGNYDMIADFGANGLWKYTVGNWSNLTTWNADNFMLSNLNGGNYDTIADFGINGLWKYSGGNWSSLTSWDADNVMLSRLNSGSYDVISDFGTNGLWKYSGGNWTNLTTWNPLAFVLSELNGGNYDIVTDFGTNGLWMYSGGNWTNLSNWSPDNLMLSQLNSGSYDIVTDFGSNGLWKYSGGSWSNLTSWNADTFMLSQLNGSSYDIVTDFGSNGLWKYSGGSWSNLTTWDADNFMLSDLNSGSYDTIVDFGSNGFWKYSGGSWSQLSSWNAEYFMLSTNTTAGQYDIIADFGDNGYWRYSNSEWSQLSSWSPENEVSQRLDVQNGVGTAGHIAPGGFTFTRSMGGRGPAHQRVGEDLWKNF